jgi:hypothetical protein
MMNTHFWEPQLIAVSKELLNLRSFVLERSHKRLPKWKFRLAADLVFQIQPKPGERRDNFYIFDCSVLAGDGITRESFNSRQLRREQKLWKLSFGILADGDGWKMKPHLIGGPAGWNYDQGLLFRDRVIAHWEEKLENLSPTIQLSPYCLCCGKALTDPASIARLIGPECFGSSSLSVPWVIQRLTA